MAAFPKQSRVLCALVLCALMSFPTAGTAQEQQGIALGQFRLLPTIGLSFGYDDNVALTNEEEPVESYFYVISPGIRLEMPTDRSVTSLTWSAEIGRYSDSSIDDYEDQGLRLDWVYDPNARHNFTAFAGWRFGHDRRGERFRQGDDALLPVEPDEWEQKQLGASWTYGALGARGRLQIDVAATDLAYTNNDEYTFYRDYRQEQLGASFFWRIFSKSRLGVGAEWSTFDYDHQDDRVASLDSEAEYFYVGFEWDLSARTTGRVDYGYHEKTFDDPLREGYDGSFWRASVDWMPRTYSLFTLTASRNTDETDGWGNYILRDNLSLAWNHSWNTHLSTSAEIGIGNEQHRPDPREDDYFWWGLSARWHFNRYLQLGVGWQHYERDSAESLYIYDRNVWIITLEASL